MSKPRLSKEEKRNRDAEMQYYLNSVAMLQVAAGAAKAGYRSHRHNKEFAELIAAYSDHHDYVLARLPQ